MAIKFDQAGLSAGVSGYSRTDGLATGAQVTITRDSPDTGMVRLVMTPAGDTTAYASWQQTSSTTWTFMPTAGVYGSYHAEEITLPGTTREIRQRRIFGIRLPRSRLLIPALNERADMRANMVDVSASITSASDNNATDFLLNADLSALNYGGWWRSMVELYRVAENSCFLRPAKAVLTETPTAYGISTLSLPTAEQCDGVTIAQGDRVVALRPVLLNGVWYSVFRHAGAYLAGDIPESRMQVDGAKMDVLAGNVYAGKTLRYSTARQLLCGSAHWWYPDGAPMYHVCKHLSPAGGSATWVNLITTQMAVHSTAVHKVTVKAAAKLASWTEPRIYSAYAEYIGDGNADTILFGSPPSLAAPGETDVSARMRILKVQAGISVDALQDDSTGSSCDYHVNVDFETVRLV